MIHSGPANLKTGQVKNFGKVLTFLLIHYFYDHFLFRDFAPLEDPEAVRVRAS